MNNDRVWLIGRITLYDSWMCEGVFLNEKDAMKYCKHGEFIILVDINERLPEQATQAIKMYWPNEETWEQSTLYRIRNNAN
jgi:hypothetical protein